MATAEVESIGVVPAPALDAAPEAPSGFERYASERAKRIGKGLGQYVELRNSDQLKAMLEDPWVGSGTPINQVIQDGGHRKILIVGAGLGGILFAVNFIKVGFSVDDLIIVDTAGGFGGTWYWNRYPGLMCDVESYLYLPMLEEMQYMPTEKYASGHEICQYCESICQRYKLQKAAMFQSKVTRMAWDKTKCLYEIDITEIPKGGKQKHLSITTDYAVLAGGILSIPKVPILAGSDAFNGDMFHTSRWNYKVTGGSPADPSLDRLKNKKVGIIGTGATSIQIVPQLGKWAKELIVFQRTPSAVDARDNIRTDPDIWKSEIAAKPGWQKDRHMNWFAFVGNAEVKPEINLVNDGWTRMPSYSALVGGPSYNVTRENVGEHVARMNALDYPNQERIRRRVQRIVKDEATAESLQAYFQGWCKRPCFHDEYLPAFNLPTVTLVDTDGKGVDAITANGVKFAGKEYPVDVLIWSTGYLSPGVGNAATKAGFHLIGKDGQTIDEQYKNGTSTLHGVMSRGFPNLFWPGPFQTGASPNLSFSLEELAKHVAFIVRDSCNKAGGTAVIEATAEAEDRWTKQIQAGSSVFASVANCTPGYLNGEGERHNAPIEMKMKAAKSSPWPQGIVDYINVLEAWRAAGHLDGINIRPKPTTA